MTRGVRATSSRGATGVFAGWRAGKGCCWGGCASFGWGLACNENGTFKTYAELKALYEGKGITSDKDVVAYCRIGERSSHTWFVLKYLLGYPNVKNYDGSWTEWGNLVAAPLERGAYNARCQKLSNWKERMAKFLIDPLHIRGNYLNYADLAICLWYFFPRRGGKDSIASFVQGDEKFKYSIILLSFPVLTVLVRLTKVTSMFPSSCLWEDFLSFRPQSLFFLGTRYFCSSYLYI